MAVVILDQFILHRFVTKIAFADLEAIARIKINGQNRINNSKSALNSDLIQGSHFLFLT